MNKNTTALGLMITSVITIMFSSSGVAAKGIDGRSLDQRLIDCSESTLDRDRLKCFDSLVQERSVMSSRDVKEPNVLPDDLGGGKFEKTKEAPPQSHGVVKSCQKSHDGKWFFIFENGQVWKQVDRAKRRYRDCNFGATIIEDGFGYKLYVDGDERKIRVRRHK